VLLLLLQALANWGTGDTTPPRLVDWMGTCSKANRPVRDEGSRPPARRPVSSTLGEVAKVPPHQQQPLLYCTCIVLVQRTLAARQWPPD
jgi:hypothetical protein